MKVLSKNAKYVLIIALFFASFAALHAQDQKCDSKRIRERMIATKSMNQVKTRDTTLGFRLEIDNKVKVFYKNQEIAGVDKAAAYLTYKQKVGTPGKEINYFLLITIGGENHSYLFVNSQEIRQLEPKMQNPQYNYFQIAIDDRDILFDFSQAGEKFFHLGIIENKIFCDGGEALIQ